MATEFKRKEYRPYDFDLKEFLTPESKEKFIDDFLDREKSELLGGLSKTFGYSKIQIISLGIELIRSITCSNAKNVMGVILKEDM